MKKQFTIYFLILFFSGNLMAQCPPFLPTFQTQSQIDNFASDYPNCVDVQGQLIIEEAAPGTITNLNGLSQITSIESNFHVFSNSGLPNFQGLESLESIGGEFIINGNEGLINFQGLENLTAINGSSLAIFSNTGLSNMEGLSGLETLPPSITIRENPSLTSLLGFGSANASTVFLMKIFENASLVNLSGLEWLEQVDSSLYIRENPSLTSLTGLENLTNANWIWLYDNNQITNLSGLSSLNTVSRLAMTRNDNFQNLLGLSASCYIDRLVIDYNDSFENMIGFPNQTSLNYLQMWENSSMQDFTGMDHVTEIGNFFVAEAPYDDFTGLDNVTTVNALNVFYCNSLTSFNGFNNLQNVTGSMTLNGASLLPNFTGLNNLQSVAGPLNINLTSSLTTLDGLESLTALGSLQFESNSALTDISALSNVDFVNYASSFSILLSQNLSLCSYPNICDFIVNGGDFTVYPTQAFGCNSISEILAGCYPDVDHFEGRVVADTEPNCQIDPNEVGGLNWLVHAYNDDYSITIPTDSLGYYWIPLFADDWTLEAISPSAFWSNCFVDTMLVSAGVGDTIVTDFVMTPSGDCPLIDWDFSMPLLRFCTDRVFTINYCNTGAEPANDIIFSVDLDSFLIFQEASVPYTIGPDGAYLFEVDSIDLFECGAITFIATIECEPENIGSLQCLDIEVLPKDLCSPNPAWDESTIAALGYCENDSIYFQLENIGIGDMAQPLEFRVDIVIDDIILLKDVDNYQLNAGDSMMLSYALDGMGLQLMSPQSMDHPVSEAISVVVPNCEDIANNSILSFLPSNDGNPFMETFCGTIIASCDPNLKYAIPSGLGMNNEIDKDWNLDYTIQFQNTGSDTAFLVIIKDTLSENLDLTTLKIRGGSHPFTWDLNAQRELTFTFENILLPDSTTNEPRSHGIVGFSILPKSDLLPGATIENRVGIYFDFNEAVITNTVLHTIRKPVVTSSEHVDWCAGEEYNGIEISQDTSIQILTEYIEYDSIHFIHFDVASELQNSVAVEVEIGDYFENILILGDTTFTQSYESQMGCDSLVTYLVNGLTDINEQLFTQVKVYPNPVNDFLLVLDHQNSEDQAWELVNNLGLVIWNEQLDANETLDQISMASLPAGVYWLHVKTDTATAVWKVVKR